jgi:hypothetical protein
MKQRIYAACFVLLISTQSIAVSAPAQTPQQGAPAATQNQQQDFDSTPHVLQSFGGMISSFLDILADPDNPKHVVDCVSDMIQGMVDIHNVGMRRSYEQTEELNDQLIEELIEFFSTEEGKEFLRRWKATIAQRTRSFNIA